MSSNLKIQLTKVILYFINKNLAFKDHVVLTKGMFTNPHFSTEDDLVNMLDSASNAYRT